VPHDDPGWLADWQAIEVDAAAGRQLAATLQCEVHGNLEAHVREVYQGYAAGTTFGTKDPRVDLPAVGRRYQECLAGTVDQLAAYVEASSILVAAASEIALRYRTADELAAANVTDIDNMLSDAVGLAQPNMDFGHDVSASGAV